MPVKLHVLYGAAFEINNRALKKCPWENETGFRRNRLHILYTVLLVYYELLPINISGKLLQNIALSKNLHCKFVKKTGLLYKCRSYVLSLKYRKKMGQRWRPQQSTVYFKDEHTASQGIREWFSILAKINYKRSDGI